MSEPPTKMATEYPAYPVLLDEVISVHSTAWDCVGRALRRREGNAHATGGSLGGEGDDTSCILTLAPATGVIVYCIVCRVVSVGAVKIEVCLITTCTRATIW